MERIASRFVLLFLIVSAASAYNVFAQTELQAQDLRVIKGTPLESTLQEMLFKYLLRQSEQATAKRLARLNSVRSNPDFTNWQETNRKKFLDLIGGLPSKRSALNVRVVGEFARQGYLVRKVIFESLPGTYVTANLYVPTAGSPPFPAVLSPCGHSANGKAYAEYQHLFIGLVKRGYVVLTYDPMGQGERYQYWDFLANRRRFDFNEHGMAGIQEYLLGQNFARYRIWDGIRALDYLTALPEVDPSRIGVTGNSGGGTLTTFISMLDERVKAASIVTYITSIPKKIEARINDAETDPEQDVAGLLAVGIDHTEFVGMIAPRPVLIGAATRDFFPIEGTRQTFKELQELYARIGVPDRVKMVQFDHRHMYSQPLREATYGWFDRWLKGNQNDAREPGITAEAETALRCTPTGQVITSLGGDRISDFNRVEADRLLGGIEERRRAPAFGEALLSNIRERLSLPPGPPQGSAHKVGETTSGNLAIEKILVESEPGIVVPTSVVVPKNASGRLPGVILLRDREGEGDRPAFIEALARQGKIVAVADVRGFGETMSSKNVPERGIVYFHPRDGMDADFTYASFFLGRPLLGMRVADALEVSAYLRSRPDVDTRRIAVVGRGWAGVVALFAAALDPGIQAAAVEGIPASYGEIARSEIYQQPVSLMLPDVLRDFDLPDVAGAVAPRALLVLNPTDALTKKMTREAALEALKPASSVFQGQANSRALEIEVFPLEEGTVNRLLDWLARS